MVRNKTIFLVLLATALLYANSLRNGFVWDDNTFIVNNPYLKSYRSVPLFFSEDAWRLSASPMDSPYYRPLLFLSFFVDHLFWGLNPFGYHLTNLLIHLANVLLVFYLVRLVCGSEDLALFSSLFFAVHPIQTEVVNFICARVDSLAFLFYLASFLLFIKSIRSAVKRRLYLYLLSLLGFAAGLLTKEILITLPVFLIFYLLFLQQDKKWRLPRQIALLISPYLGVFALYLLARNVVLGRLNLLLPPGPTVLVTYSSFLVKMTGLYLRLLLLPWGLSVEHPPATLSSPLSLFGSLLCIAIPVLVVIVFRRQRLIWFAVGWFLITMFPMFVYLPKHQLLSERYVYISSLGFFMLLGFLFFRAGIGLDVVIRRGRNRPGVFLLALLISYYSAYTFQRSQDWKDEFTLWSRTAEITPRGLLAPTNLVGIYREKGLRKELKKTLFKILELSPFNAEAHSNLGVLYYEEGDLKMAVAEFKTAIRLNPRWAVVYKNLAIVYAAMGQEEKAKEEYGRYQGLKGRMPQDE